jgi:hypothetical protein
MSREVEMSALAQEFVNWGRYKSSKLSCASRIQVGTATNEFVFAPEERDVYSYESTPKSRSVRSETGAAEPSSGQAKTIALLRSFE